MAMSRNISSPFLSFLTNKPGIEYRKELSDDRKMIYLVSSDFNIEKDVIGRGDVKLPNNIITTNDDMFWQRPL